MSSTPIAEHALLSDCHSSALVDSAGSVEWLCFPRFDSPSIFARLLDDAAGHWWIRPVDEGTPAGSYEVSRRYLDRTMVLETTFRTPTGTLVLTDALAMGLDNDGHQLGSDVPHLLLRAAACTGGEVTIEVSYEPRPEYGLVVPLLSEVEGGILARGGAERLLLSTTCPLSCEQGTARGTATLAAGQTLRFALHRAALEGNTPRAWGSDEQETRLDETVRAWRSWADMHQSYDGPWDHLVHHSGRVLQALTFQPTGAIIAAPTTSLPESVGGDRNWDYRYSWLRDASLTMQALWVAACPDEGEKFFDFVAGSAADHLRKPLQIMFGVGGEHDLTERELEHLAGWRGSKPVRVGNGAWSQQQIDVYGELLDAVSRLREQLSDMDEESRGFLLSLADAAAARWEDKDQGIWEMRGDPRHFLHSKVMCWVALDRAVDLAGVLRPADDQLDTWRRTREKIREAVERDGWNEKAAAFTQSFGSDALDASVLMLVIVGFLPRDDFRVLSTIDAVEKELTDDRGLLRRYLIEGGGDGLKGEEGAFLLCTFWLAEALACSDQVDRARAVFERAIEHVNDVGLLAEEIEPKSGEQLGNFPQAFSHIGLVNAAWAISEAERRARDREDDGKLPPPDEELAS